VQQIVADTLLTPEGIKAQWVTGAAPQDVHLINPVNYPLAYLNNIASAENKSTQLQHEYDNRTTAQSYPRYQQYLRTYEVPLLDVCGRNDQLFLPSGAEDFKRDLPNAVVHLVDAGTFRWRRRDGTYEDNERVVDEYWILSSGRGSCSVDGEVWLARRERR
jgi:hypothetical protein